MNARKLAESLMAAVNRVLPWAPRRERRASVQQAAETRQQAERAQQEIEYLQALTGDRIAERLRGEIRAGRHLHPGQQ